MIVLLEASRIQEAFLLQRNKYLEDYELIKNSGYFDTEFYIDEYPNILDFKLDPIEITGRL